MIRSQPDLDSDPQKGRPLAVYSFQFCIYSTVYTKEVKQIKGRYLLSNLLMGAYIAAEVGLLVKWL